MEVLANVCCRIVRFVIHVQRLADLIAFNVSA